ncbi:MAG: hypothetical protein GWN86_06885 [Desulfobacterales bacterium]|nr:hypothetical protein [Desulfobacterales bacterium]
MPLVPIRSDADKELVFPKPPPKVPTVDFSQIEALRNLPKDSIIPAPFKPERIGSEFPIRGPEPIPTPTFRSQAPTRELRSGGGVSGPGVPTPTPEPVRPPDEPIDAFAGGEPDPIEIARERAAGRIIPEFPEEIELDRAARRREERERVKNKTREDLMRAASVVFGDAFISDVSREEVLQRVGRESPTGFDITDPRHPRELLQGRAQDLQAQLDAAEARRSFAERPLREQLPTQALLNPFAPSDIVGLGAGARTAGRFAGRQLGRIGREAAEEAIETGVETTTRRAMIDAVSEAAQRPQRLEDTLANAVSQPRQQSSRQFLAESIRNRAQRAGDIESALPEGQSVRQAMLSAVDEYAQQIDDVNVARKARKVGEAIGSDPVDAIPRQTDVGLSQDLDIPTHERFRDAIMRKLEGSRDTEALGMEQAIEDGSNLMKSLGFGNELDDATFGRLIDVLEGFEPRNILSAAERRLYDALDVLRKAEEDDMLKFLAAATEQGADLRGADAEAIAARFLANPEYFPRLWKIPGKNVGASGNFGLSPGFLRGRKLADMSTSELMEAGMEPISKNPFRLFAMRRLEGVEYRENIKFLNRAIQRGLAKPMSQVTEPRGWKVPKAGRVFEGRPTPDGFTESIALPNELANFIESMYGRQPQLIIRDVDFVPFIRRWSNRAKRVKLLGSLFQHADITTRALAANGTFTAIRSSGGPIQWPSLITRLFRVSMSRGARNQLRRDLLAGRKIYDDFDITYRMLLEEGWNVAGDLSFMKRELGRFVDDVRAGFSAVGTQPSNSAFRKLNKLADFFESGLFDGVYREAQRDALVKFIIPALRRRHPNWTARQIASAAAPEVNKMFSALGNYQTILKDPGLRAFVHTLAFSSNETESGIRMFLSAITGPNKALWQEWWLGLLTSLAITANGINFVATGRPLPLEAYNPFDTDDPYAPFNDFGYNNRFLSPQIPLIKGRDGQPLFLDLVGQMDTALRWLLSPASAFAARTNVIPRAVVNQARGENFFGDEFGVFDIKRLATLLEDLVVPIGAGSLIQGAKPFVPGAQDVLPRGEERLGPQGQGIQGIGFNLRAERQDEAKQRVTDAMLREGALVNPDTGNPYPTGTTFAELDGASQQQVLRNQTIEQPDEKAPPKLPEAREAFNLIREEVNNKRAVADTKLGDLIREGVSGKRLREAIQERNKALVAYNEWFENPLAQQAIDDFKRASEEEAIDIFRERYWAVDYPEPDRFGVIDFSDLEAHQREVLDDASLFGFTESQVRLRKASEDPDVDRVLQAWRDDLENWLIPYWNLDDQYFERVPTAERRELEAAWDRYRTAGAQEKRILRVKLPRDVSAFVRRLERQLELDRARARRVPEMEAALIRWGYYTGRARTDAGRVEEGLVIEGRR